ncbi:MAG: hypothetical protein EP216_01870 [Epsilonproteobacteria bacterium]|nr:MAG: hypothetical protein EP216_01870 [Campylobacterota bacterium]
MKTTSLKLSALAAGFILAGCGGGGSSTTSSTTQTSKISGTVPGTLIEAFCADGSYYKVTSTQNNTNEHPFEIEIPSTVSCSLVMTTNEDDPANKVVTQIGMITSDANGTLFTASADIDLGHIPLAMDPSQVNDENGDHVSDDILEIQVDGTFIEIEFENPLDDDDDGLVNIYEDDDGDGINNHDDEDDDNDEILDIHEQDDDLDDDGIDNDSDVDDDNDGIRDSEDSDDDNDGIDDYLDSDDDNDGHDDDEDSSNTTAEIVLPTSYSVNAGRLLGSQCAQCHGTNGISTNEWDSIAGEDRLEDEIFDDEPIMRVHAHGYTSEEITLIGNWLKTLKTND